MKTKLMKIVGAALLTVALTQTVQAIPITGAVTFGGTITLANAANVPVSDVALAAKVSGWFGLGGVGSPFVASSGGSLAATPGAAVVFATPWAFGTQAALWSYVALNGDTYTFSLTSITSGPSVSGSPSTLTVTGLGSISVTAGPSLGFTTTPATWAFSTQNPQAGGVFSFSAASDTTLPDGASTAMLLGFALSGVALLKKKFIA
jgi:hypothetical protein